MNSNKVFVYALSTCSHCRKAKNYLKDNNIEFDYVDVDLTEGEERASVIDDVKKYNPRCTFPTIIIGDVTIVGFHENDIKKALAM